MLQFTYDARLLENCTSGFSQLPSFTHSLYYLSTTQLTLICWITGFIFHSGFGFQLCTFLYHAHLLFTFRLSTAQALTTGLEGLEA